MVYSVTHYKFVSLSLTYESRSSKGTDTGQSGTKTYYNCTLHHKCPKTRRLVCLDSTLVIIYEESVGDHSTQEKERRSHIPSMTKEFMDTLLRRLGGRCTAGVVMDYLSGAVIDGDLPKKWMLTTPQVTTTFNE